ncbi:MAG: hypothetical protein PVG78_15335 [Desulfobacterales bacterium]|jgi:hypothetical protein
MKHFGYGQILIALFAVLLLSACGPPKWAIQRWGEDQYMSYRIDFAKNVYVTVNPAKDDLLRFSYYLLGTPRLGRSLTGENGKAEPLSDRAFYVDVSAAGVNHDYYLGPDRPETLAAFYRNVIMAAGVDPLKGPGVLETDRPQVYAVSP